MELLPLKQESPIEVAPKRLGHASVAITADICHLLPGTDREAAETIARFLFKASPS